jgi:hypothetical protein
MTALGRGRVTGAEDGTKQEERDDDLDAARFRAIAVALFLAALAALTLSAGAGASPNKPYSIVICGAGQIGCTSKNPAVIAPGGTTVNPSNLSVTFTNDNKLGTGIKLGSDNLTVPSTPAGFLVISTSLPTCPPKFNNHAPACFVLLNGGTTVGFRNLNLSPGQLISISVSAVTPAPSATACTTTSPCLWTDEAKQSNDFNGKGNDLNSDANSAYGTVMSAVASCAKQQGCSTTLGNGGTATSAPGSISTTVATSSGTTTVTQLESIDFGPPLDPSKCSGVSSPHLTYENLSNGADNGSDRSQTVTINTTDFSGYVSEVCFEDTKQFTQLVIASEGTESLAPANPTTLPDGSPGFQGLLPDCGTKPLQPLQVYCTKNPGVSQRQTTTTTQGTTHTVVVAIPPGFDLRMGN